MPGVTCGESLTTYITAFDDECPSERNLGEVAETGKDKSQSVISAVSHTFNKTISLSISQTHHHSITYSQLHIFDKFLNYLVSALRTTECFRGDELRLRLHHAHVGPGPWGDLLYGHGGG